MAQGPKAVRRLAGDASNAKDAVAVPVNPEDLLVAVKQLQDTVNELIAHFNAHQHSALNAAPATDLHTGAGATATNLFVNAAQ